MIVRRADTADSLFIYFKIEDTAAQGTLEMRVVGRVSIEALFLGVNVHRADKARAAKARREL